ncbi:MAG: YgaP family membrane protein [Bacteroidales bacterium]
MKKNIGKVDRIIRVLIAMLITVLYFTKIISGTAGLVLLIIAGILMITSVTSFCGIYTLFGISTCKTDIKN